MWAADFDEEAIRRLEENCLGPLLVDLRTDLSCEVKEVPRMNSSTRRKSKTRKSHRRNGEICGACHPGTRSSTRNHLCGLSGATIWARPQHMPQLNANVLARSGDDELPIFCVAAILIINRHRIIRGTRSIDDAIKASSETTFFLVNSILVLLKSLLVAIYSIAMDILQMFNDNVLKINVKRCVRLAIKLRKKYLYKVNSDAALLNLFSINLGLINISTRTIHSEVGFLLFCLWRLKQALKGGSSDDKES